MSTVKEYNVRMKEIIVIGGGPAGMMAAISASQNGAPVRLLEKKDSLGKKLLMTGKGRANFTNARPLDEIVAAFGRDGRWLYGALTRFSNQDLIHFFESRGVLTKIERGRRVFPTSDRATDILRCLQKGLHSVEITFNAPVRSISSHDRHFHVVSTSQTYQAGAVIIATGGLSYPETGSTGDGYRWAKNFGHTILPLKPGLNSLYVADRRLRSLAGLTLKNVLLTIWSSDQKKGEAFGELLITHQGLSGPVAYSLCKTVYDLTQDKNPCEGRLDFKPRVDKSSLHHDLYRRIHAQGKKEACTLLKSLLPVSAIPLALRETMIDPHMKNGELSPEKVSKLIMFLKGFSFMIPHTGPISTAIVTAGGVDYHEVNPQTMESKRISGLFFAGEVIGLDGPTGGYNLQKAFSTGWAAGSAASGHVHSRTN